MTAKPKRKFTLQLCNDIEKLRSDDFAGFNRGVLLAGYADAVKIAMPHCGKDVVALNDKGKYYEARLDNVKYAARWFLIE